MQDVTERCFPARLDCHYLLRQPDATDSQTILVLALHGFGENPAVMLERTGRLFDAKPVLASLQGPNQFFRDLTRWDVGYGWLTNVHPAECIRLHHDMVFHVLEEAGREFGIPPSRRFLVGFSQSVSLNYRFAATHPDAVRGVIAICGGIPGDWDNGSYQTVRAALLHIAGTKDAHYVPSVTEQYAARLRQRAEDVDFHLIDGGHQMPSDGSRIVSPWLQRILSQRS